jgi:chaperonin cofactor prefoldin
MDSLAIEKMSGTVLVFVNQEELRKNLKEQWWRKNISAEVEHLDV